MTDVATDAADIGGAADGRDDSAGTPRRHYHPVGIAFHWTIAALLAFQLFWGWRMGRIDAGYDALGAYGVHAAIGLTVFLLASMRGAWRIFESVALPDLEYPEDFPGWQRLAAMAVHAALYLVTFALPLSGWIMLSADGRREDIALGLGLSIPRITPVADLDYVTRARWEETMQIAHGWLVVALIGLLLAHIGAALKHHFINRDGVLARMIPALSRDEQAGQDGRRES